MPSGSLWEAGTAWARGHLREEKGDPTAGKGSCMRPQHLGRFEQLSLEVSLCISCREKLNGVSSVLGLGVAVGVWGVLGESFKNKFFGAAATALDSQVWTLPEGSGLYTVAFLKGSFPKHQELFLCCRTVLDLCSAFPAHRNRA